MDFTDNTPIVIGAGQKTWHATDPGRTPVDALCEASAVALADADNNRLIGAIDTVGLVRFIADTTPDASALFPRNPGEQLSERLGITGASMFQGIIGGNSPQYLVNHFANQLAQGEHDVVLLAGSELLATFFAALRSGDNISSWAGEPAAEPPTIGQERTGHTAMELAHGLYEPINTYPLFENSLRHHLGTSKEEHSAQIAELYSRMSKVAAGNSYAWRQQHLSAEQISTVTSKNRYIGYPYTRAMNPTLEVDMAAAIILTTAGKARELGIDPARWIYFRGGADVNDIWHVSERPSLHISPAIESAWKSISQQSGITLDEISRFDIYNCFPSAVQVACRAIGLSPLDQRGVTVTGGMPCFGGPGNNYSLHAIAEMVATLRKTGSGHGLVTANGLYLTKHSLGLYSTEPPTKAWQPIDSAPLQALIATEPPLPLALDPSGKATIETYTVSYGREGPKQGIVIARNETGERVVATTGTDERTMDQLIAQDPIGCSGNIDVQDGINVLEL
jgi:acetyl-CoA C-acetyltransferase